MASRFSSLLASTASRVDAAFAEETHIAAAPAERGVFLTPAQDWVGPVAGIISDSVSEAFMRGARANMQDRAAAEANVTTVTYRESVLAAAGVELKRGVRVRFSSRAGAPTYIVNDVDSDGVARVTAQLSKL